jgi:hypothetical protein
MSTMSKVFEYCDHKFYISVVLNAVVEKKPDGERWHEITVNAMGPSNFYTRHKVLDCDIEKYIALCEQKCIDYVDTLNPQSKTERYLLSVGFK